MSEVKPLNKEFLLSRGKCCGSGCLNCPYIPKHIKNNITINTNDMLKYKERIEKINEEDGGGDIGNMTTSSNIEGMGNPEFAVADNVGSGDRYDWGGIKKFKKNDKKKKSKPVSVKSFKDFFTKGNEVQPK